MKAYIFLASSRTSFESDKKNEQIICLFTLRLMQFSRRLDWIMAKWMQINHFHIVLNRMISIFFLTNTGGLIRHYETGMFVNVWQLFHKITMSTRNLHTWKCTAAISISWWPKCSRCTRSLLHTIEHEYNADMGERKERKKSYSKSNWTPLFEFAFNTQ